MTNPDRAIIDRNNCGDKEAHRSEAAAVEHAIRVSTPGLPASAYVCPTCDRYHVTSKPTQVLWRRGVTTRDVFVDASNYRKPVTF